MTAADRDEGAPSPHEVIVGRLTDARVPFTIHEHAPLRTVEDAAAASGFDEERFLKTLLFRGGANGWVLVALRGRDRLDYRRLADALGVSRSMVAAATPDDVRAVTGCEPGAVSPVPTAGGLPLLLDELASTLDTIYTGAGRDDRTIEMRIENLIAAVRPRVVALRREDPTGNSGPA